METSNQLQSRSLSQDLISVLFRGILSFLFIILGNSITSLGGLNLILGFILIIFGVFQLMGVFNSFISMYHYKKAYPEVGDRYLRGVVPQCPYLTVTASGFRCLIEFNRDFDISTDLPICHGNEDVFKAHWMEKAPGVFEIAQNEKNPRLLMSWITLLANTKYTPAIPLIRQIVYAPNINHQRRLIISILQAKDEVPPEELKNEYVSNYQKTLINQNDPDAVSISSDEIHNQFEHDIELLIRYGLIENKDLDGNPIISITEKGNKSGMLLRWKIDSNQNLKNIAIIALGSFQKPELLSDLLTILDESTNPKTDQFIIKSITKLGEMAIPNLIDIASSDDYPENKRCTIISALGQMNSEEPFVFLSELVQNTENDLVCSYAITALGRLPGVKGLNVIIDILKDEPDDLELSAGRSVLIEKGVDSLPLLFDSLESNVTNDYREIIISIFQDIELPKISKYIKSLSKDEQDRVLDLLEENSLSEYMGFP
ncbi:MAG: HEAT repeat domain-containing protein [Candidatus Hodarchaeales archaeon]|jgi:hypothetical protein